MSKLLRVTGFEHLEIFRHFYKEDNFMTSCLRSCNLGPFKKGSTLKQTNLLPQGTNYFLLE